MFAHINSSVFTPVLMVALFSLQSWFTTVTSHCSLENVCYAKEKNIVMQENRHKNDSMCHEFIIGVSIVLSI